MKHVTEMFIVYVSASSILKYKRFGYMRWLPLCSIHSNSSHVGWFAVSSGIILKINTPKEDSIKYCSNLLEGFRGDFLKVTE